MRLPHVNSFFWIGLLLIGIAIYSFVKGPTFQFDAGVPNEKFESLIYLAVGALMIVNGLFHPAPTAEEKQKTEKQTSAATPNGTASSTAAQSHAEPTSKPKTGKATKV